MEPQHQGNDGIEQGAITQELASLNVLLQVVDQMGGKPGIEGTLEFNKEFCTMTLELSHGKEIIEEEPQ